MNSTFVQGNITWHLPIIFHVHTFEVRIALDGDIWKHKVEHGAWSVGSLFFESELDAAVAHAESIASIR